MSRADESRAPLPEADERSRQAAAWFLRVRAESASVDDLPEFDRWMNSDPQNALAYRQVTASWNLLDGVASAPEVMAGRRDALEHARRAARGRWSLRRRFPARLAAAAAVLILLLSGLAWLYSQRGVYSTDLGERRVLTLADGSVVTLDALSRIRVDYRENERGIVLERGQASFDVAKDPSRAFRVRAGGQTVIALGTQFNVERVASELLVTLINGHVAVTGVRSAKPVELIAGESLRVHADGHAVKVAGADVMRATAWQSGKLFFDKEPLAIAAERVNRYSRVHIDVDPAVADVAVSGVFNVGGSGPFVEAVAEYFPVKVDRPDASTIRLVAR